VGRYALALDKYVLGRPDGTSPITDVGEVDIAGESRTSIEIDQGGPPVQGRHPRSEPRGRLTVRLLEPVNQERARRRRDVRPVCERVRQLRLDSPVARTLEFDLEHTVRRVEICTGSHLVSAPSALQVLPVGQQVRRVEVHRLVSEATQPVDLQDRVTLRQPNNQLGEALDGDHVLAVDADLQCRLFGHLGQARRRQGSDGVGDLGRGS
jgi:hypothetical protein